MRTIDLGTWSPETAAILAASGWYPGRSVRDLLPRWKGQLCDAWGFEWFGAAERVLFEFGGLHIRSEGPGQSCARSSVVLDPIAAAPDKDEVAWYAGFAGQDLFPVGDVGGGALYVGRDGAGYLGYEDFFEKLAPTFCGSLDMLVLGIRGEELPTGPSITVAPPGS